MPRRLWIRADAKVAPSSSVPNSYAQIVGPRTSFAAAHTFAHDGFPHGGQPSGNSMIIGLANTGWSWPACRTYAQSTFEGANGRGPMTNHQQHLPNQNSLTPAKSQRNNTCHQTGVQPCQPVSSSQVSICPTHPAQARFMRGRGTPHSPQMHRLRHRGLATPP